MAVYMLFLRETAVQNQEAMAEYQRLVGLFEADYKPIPRMIRCNILDVVEGEAPNGLVMLEFPTVEAARDWYDSPGYQAALPHRLKAARYRAMIIGGL